MPQLNFSTYTSQIFWLIISFSLMLLIMRFFIVPRISSIIDERNRNIKTYIKKAEKLQEEALIKLDQYNKAIEQAKTAIEKENETSMRELDEFLRRKSEEATKILTEKAAENAKMLSEQKEQALAEAQKIADNVFLSLLDKLEIKSINTPDKEASVTNEDTNHG